MWQIKWNWIRSMKFETVRIYFLSEFSVCCHPKILLPWQRDVTTSSLYSFPAKITFSSSLFSFKNRHRTYLFDRAYEQAECGLGRYVDVSYYCISALHLISMSFQFCTRAVIDRNCVNTLRSSISSSLFLILQANFFTLTTHFFWKFSFN